jgi:hypothetical protein
MVDFYRTLVLPGSSERASLVVHLEAKTGDAPASSGDRDIPLCSNPRLEIEDVHDFKAGLMAGPAFRPRHNLSTYRLE